MKSGNAQDLKNAKRCSTCNGIVAPNLDQCFPCKSAGANTEAVKEPEFY